MVEWEWGDSNLFLIQMKVFIRTKLTEFEVLFQLIDKLTHKVQALSEFQKQVYRIEPLFL